MTIRFDCPKCGSLIAFPDKYAGLRAHCENCGQSFVIPGGGKKKVKKIRDEAEREVGESLPGFYKALFVNSGRLFTGPYAATGIVFVTALVFVWFYTANRNFSLFIQGEWLRFDFYIPFGYFMTAVTWGFLFWYYMQIINETAFDREGLPELVTGGFYSIVWNIAKSLYTIFVILLVVELPCLVTYLIFLRTGTVLPWLLYTLFFGGLFLLPMGILTAAVGGELTLLRPGALIGPIFKAFGPYLVTAILPAAAVCLQIKTPQYERGMSTNAQFGYFLLNLALQPLFLVAMRAIGLYYRHFGSHINWK